MAASKKPSKFQFVQSFFASNPDATADAAVKAASKAGLDISVQYARQIRSKSKTSKPKTKKAKRPKLAPRSKVTRAKKAAPKNSTLKKSPSAKAKPKATTGSSANIDQALEAVRFIKRIGDVKTARQAIDAAEAILAEVQG